MKQSFIVFSLFLLATAGFSQAKKPATATKPAAKSAVAANPFKNNVDSTSYALGIRIGQSLKQQGFDNINMALFQKALADQRANKTVLLDDAAIQQCFTRFQENAVSIKAAGAIKEGKAFLEKNGKRTGVVTLPSGLQYEVLKAGTDNTRPTLASKVKCHYTGTLLNGTKFDSSVDRGEPITFALANVIRGWQEGLQLMTVGSKWKLYIPADLAYGDNGPPNIGPGATLVFEVELLGVEN
jgi:FKBP-type peptidyl-prolyl cis-trans isomerase FklB